MENNEVKSRGLSLIYLSALLQHLACFRYVLAYQIIGLYVFSPQNISEKYKSICITLSYK